MSEKLLTRLSEIRDEAAELRDELAALADADELDEGQEARFNELVAEDSPIETLSAEREDIERRLKVLEAASKMAAIEVGDDRGAPQYMKKTATDVDALRGESKEVRDAALAYLEKGVDEFGLTDRQATQAERLIRSGKRSTDGDAIARRVLLTENEHYRSAFQKAMLDPNPAWTSEEARAINEFRVGPQSLTDASGGFGVPVFIDPTIIVTSGADGVPLLNLARVETITTPVWNGVSSVNADWSFDAELTEVSEDNVTLAQPIVTTEKAQAFIEYSIEIGSDYPGFAEEMGNLLAGGYLDLLAEESMTGADDGGVVGVFTAVDATAASEVITSTQAEINPEDAFVVWNALPQRFKRNATWLSNVEVESGLRAAATDGGFFTVDASAGGIRQLMGRPYVTDDYAPALTGVTTGEAAFALLGDFAQGYVIAQRAGMNIELVPHVFATGANRPKGARGWYAYARVGANTVNDNAFRLLKNSTT